MKRVDPRDQTWEIDEPTYRVYFHETSGSSDEYEIRGANDVSEVLSWAASAPGDRPFVIYACVPGEGLGLVRLHGTDPNNR